MKPLRALICYLLIVSQAFAGITYHGTTGQTVYARVQIAPTTFKAIQLSEGTSGGLGVYSTTDALIYAAGVKYASAGSGFPFTIRSGTASATANDTILGSGALLWDGYGELSQPTIGVDGAAAVANLGDTPDQPQMPYWVNAPDHTYYVRDTGDDGNAGSAANDAFLTIAAALAAKTSNGDSNCIIDVAGTFAISGTLTLGDDVWLRGDGVVTMTRTKGLITSGSWSGTAILNVSAGDNICVYAGNRSIVTGVKIVPQTTSGQGYSFPLGFKGTGVSSTDVIVRNVWTVGDSDGSYFNDLNGCRGVWRHYNCIFDSKFDSTQITPAASSMVAEYYHCILRATGPTLVTGGGDTRAVTALGGTIRTKDCMIVATGHTTGKLSAGVYSRQNARIFVGGGTVSGGDYDFYQSNPGLLVARAVEYSTSSGDILPDDNGINWQRIRGASTAQSLSNTEVENVTGIDVADLVNLVRAVLPPGNDANRTWVMRRTGTLVGSSQVITKNDTEATTFWADVTRLLGTNETIGDTADISVDAADCTVSEVTSQGKMISFKLTGGTVDDEAQTVTVTFDTAEGSTITCTGQLRIN